MLHRHKLRKDNYYFAFEQMIYRKKLTKNKINNFYIQKRLKIKALQQYKKIKEIKYNKKIGYSKKIN